MTDVSSHITSDIGAQSMVLPVQRLVLKHARDAFRSDQLIDRQWSDLAFTARPDYAAAVREYDAFAELLARHVPEIIYLPADDRTTIDSLYVHDPLLAFDGGIVACRMGKPTRVIEAEAAVDALRARGIPILGRIEAPGCVEGGDVVWVDRRTLAVGEGYRTNAAGIAQLAALAGKDVTVVPVPLPHWTGPADVMHLMSLISIVDDDLAVVYSRPMPVPFRNWIVERGFTLVEVPDEEFATQGSNILALAPRVCVMMAGNPVTRRRLEAAGATVYEFEGREIAEKGCGGPTCLTRPILRR